MSALIPHSQGQIAITALPSLCPLMQTLEHSLPAHKSQQLPAGICNVTNWVLRGFVFISWLMHGLALTFS